MSHYEPVLRRTPADRFPQCVQSPVSELCLVHHKKISGLLRACTSMIAQDLVHHRICQPAPPAWPIPAELAMVEAVHHHKARLR